MNTYIRGLKKYAKNTPLIFIRDLAGIFFGEKSFEKNHLLKDVNLNEWGLHQKRVAWVHQLANRRRKKLEKYIKSADAEFFYMHGYIVKENFLTESEFNALQTEIVAHSFDTREMLQGNTVTRRMSLDIKELQLTQKISGFLKQAEWNQLINFVASFKVQPMNYIQVIFSKINQDQPDPQTNFHSDTFFSSAKAWLFLTDVDESTGPFMYVPGSHRVDEKRLAWEQYKATQICTKQSTDVLSRRGSFRISREELKTFGFAEPVKFNVKANTLLIADTFGFHARGESEKPAIRAEIWAYARRNPMIPFTFGHYLALPWVKDRAVSLYWKALDMMESRQIKRSPWRKVGRKKVFDEAQITSVEDQNKV